MIGAPEPSISLYRKVRGAFVTKGTTLAEWCEKRGIHKTGARQVLIGTWNGKKGQALRAEICKAAGIHSA